VLQRVCVTGPGEAGTPCGVQGWGEGQERTGCEAKLSSAHLRARHTPPASSEMAGVLGSSFLFLVVVAQSPSASGELGRLDARVIRWTGVS
jgi:hypothetical protein